MDTVRVALSVLVVEDSEQDGLLLLRELCQHGYDPLFERVETPAAMIAALDRQKWDVVLADYSLPQFSATEALTLLKERDLEIPFILVSGTISAEVAVTLMKAGADDYIQKDQLLRLVPAIQRELRAAELRLAHKESEWKIHKLAALDEIVAKIAHGLNNSLTPILLGSQLLQSRLFDNVGNRLRDIIETNAQRSAMIVNQLLAFTRGKESDQHEAGHAAEALFQFPMGKGELVLMVDDEITIREITKLTLEAYKYRVITANDGLEAVALFRQRGGMVDVVITDILMPEMDGLATIQALHKLNPELKIIAVSGLMEGYQVSEMTEACNVRFLQKPYPLETLLRTLCEVLAAKETSYC